MSTGEQKQAAPAAGAATEEAKSGGLLDDILKRLPDTIDRDVTKDLVKNFVDEITKGTVKVEKTLIKSLNSAIKRLDEELSQQLAAVMHAPEFQKLEGSWRGLRYLVMNSETCKTLQLKVLNVTKNELFKDVDRAIEFDQSQIFKKVYEDEFGMPGGAPYGAMVGDYEFTNHPDDIFLVEKMANVAAAGFCPFLSAASPELFGFKSFTELSKPRDLEKIFMAKNYIKWESYRDCDDSRFVTLTMPRVLARLPYGKNTKPIDQFDFEEVELEQGGSISKPVAHEHYCWMNAAYVLGARLTDSFAKHNWCTSIRGRENGGTVENLPAHIFQTDDGDMDLKCPTEIGITDRRFAELDKLGFLPLVHNKNTDFSVFYTGQTTQRPRKWDTDEANANAKISARLPYIMAASRIAHFLKVIARDKLGSFMEREDCERWLKRWISQYVTSDPNPKPDQKAKYPLAEAQIVVEEVPGSPGEYRAACHLRPWLQLEALTAAISMVAKIPKLK